MTRDEQFDLIRRKCTEALCAHGTRSEQVRYKALFNRKIRLADVLLAMKPHTYFVDTQGGWWVWHKAGVEPHYFGKGTDWCLLKDDITLQSDECVAFLANLLE
jgi:hypothetical protein